MKRLVFAGAVVFFVILLCFSCTPSEDGIQGSGESLRIMTFNIRYDGPRDELNPWRIRRDPVARTIAFFKTDIVGLQETLVSQIEDLEQRLPGYSWTGVGRDDGKDEGE